MLFRFPCSQTLAQHSNQALIHRILLKTHPPFPPLQYLLCPRPTLRIYQPNCYIHQPAPPLLLPTIPEHIRPTSPAKRPRHALATVVGFHRTPVDILMLRSVRRKRLGEISVQVDIHRGNERPERDAEPGRLPAGDARARACEVARGIVTQPPGVVGRVRGRGLAEIVGDH